MKFPPYRLLDRDYIAETQAKSERLERLYHVGQQKAWDGRKLLAELLAKHGGIHLPEAKRRAIGEVFSTILWGELAAWSVAADLALTLEDTGAKMAATGQAFDEARHFYTMRDYLLELGGEIPPLDGYTRTILRDVLEAPRLADKLIGMQLIVETTAVVLFRLVAQARVEPVLSDLMPYFERDEARHVALGVLYLPTVLADAGPLETARLRLFQLKIVTLVGWGTHAKQRFFDELGIDSHAAMRQGTRLVEQTFESMREGGREPPKAVLIGSQFLAGFENKVIEVFYPPPGAQLPPWQRSMLAFTVGLARAGEAVLRVAT